MEWNKKGFIFREKLIFTSHSEKWNYESITAENGMGMKGKSACFIRFEGEIRSAFLTFFDWAVSVKGAIITRQGMYGKA